LAVPVTVLPCRPPRKMSVEMQVAALHTDEAAEFFETF
jgi:hypothetical protein